LAKRLDARLIDGGNPSAVLDDPDDAGRGRGSAFCVFVEFTEHVPGKKGNSISLRRSDHLLRLRYLGTNSSQLSLGGTLAAISFKSRCDLDRLPLVMKFAYGHYWPAPNRRELLQKSTTRQR